MYDKYDIPYDTIWPFPRIDRATDKLIQARSARGLTLSTLMARHTFRLKLRTEKWHRWSIPRKWCNRGGMRQLSPTRSRWSTTSLPSGGNLWTWLILTSRRTERIESKSARKHEYYSWKTLKDFFLFIFSPVFASVWKFDFEPKTCRLLESSWDTLVRRRSSTSTARCETKGSLSRRYPTNRSMIPQMPGAQWAELQGTWKKNEKRCAYSNYILIIKVFRPQVSVSHFSSYNDWLSILFSGSDCLTQHALQLLQANHSHIPTNIWRCQCHTLPQ